MMAERRRDLGNRSACQPDRAALTALSSSDSLQNVELRTLFTYPNQSETYYGEFGLPLRVVHLGAAGTRGCVARRSTSPAS